MENKLNNEWTTNGNQVWVLRKNHETVSSLKGAFSRLSELSKLSQLTWRENMFVLKLPVRLSERIRDVIIRP